MISTYTDVVERELYIEARPEIVFAFLTDPDQILRWKGLEATLEARPGGIYRVKMNALNIMRGEFVEVVPYSRVVFSMGWEESPTLPPGTSTVEFSLTPDGSGTILHLKHHGLPPLEQEAHAKGWDYHLARLVAVAGIPA